MRVSPNLFKLSIGIALLVSHSSVLFAQDAVEIETVTAEVIDKIPELYQPPRPTNQE